MDILNEVMTGRRYGDKKPFSVIRKFKNDEGVKCAEVEADFWEGPSRPSEKGQYKRVRWIECAGYFVNYELKVDNDGSVWATPKKRELYT